MVPAPQETDYYPFGMGINKDGKSQVVLNDTNRYLYNVAEIWYQNNLIAEINQENEQLEIEINTAKNNIFPVQEFIRVIEDAIKKLTGV